MRFLHIYKKYFQRTLGIIIICAKRSSHGRVAEDVKNIDVYGGIFRSMTFEKNNRKEGRLAYGDDDTW